MYRYLAVLVHDGVENEKKLSHQMKAAETVGDTGMKGEENKASKAFLVFVKHVNLTPVDIALKVAKKVSPTHIHG